MTRIQVQVAGEISEVSLALDDLTLQQQVTLEEIIGRDELRAVLNGAVIVPSYWRALIYVQLRSAGLVDTLDGFDLTIGTLSGEVAAGDPLPFEPS